MRGGILWDAGLPHSDTPGSKTACVSPGLFAACRVLLRLPPPRHPPRARRVWTPENRRPATLAPRLPGKGGRGHWSLRRPHGKTGAPVRFCCNWKSIFPRMRPKWCRTDACGRLPKNCAGKLRSRQKKTAENEGGLVGAHGLGPWTSSLSETRSNQLSYAPKKCHDARKRRGGIGNSVFLRFRWVSSTTKQCNTACLTWLIASALTRRDCLLLV